MTIIQSLIASISGVGGGSPPPPSGADFFWAADNDIWLALGGFYTAGLFSNPAPASTAYTYPDNSYTGVTRTFSGEEYLIGPNLGIGNAWQTNAITIDLWFYPTANGVQILSELNAQDPNAGYHYTVLELDSSGYVKAMFWQGAPQGFSQIITSSNTVFLNQWNHIYFTEDTQGGHTFELNGVGTGVQNPVYTRQGPGSTSEYFAIGISDATYMVTDNRFQGKVGYLTIHDYVAPSTYSNTVNRFRPPYSNTGITLGTNWTIEIIAELTPASFWATFWGNENYNAGLGHFAYFQNTSSLNVGSVSGMDAYNVTGIETKGYWAFTHADGGSVNVYRNGVLVTPTVSGYVQPFPAGNTLLIGARHNNDGTGTTDICTGNYYYTNVSNGTALDATAIQASYDSLKGTYGLP